MYLFIKNYKKFTKDNIILLLSIIHNIFLISEILFTVSIFFYYCFDVRNLKLFIILKWTKEYCNYE